MTSAHRFLNVEQRKAVEEAIHAAEKRTSAEIVCAIATESGRYDRAEAIVGLAMSIVCLLLLNAMLPLIAQRMAAAGNWNSPTIAFVDQAVAVAVGFLIGNMLASYWHGLRRCFVLGGQMQAEVERSAAYVFGIRRLTSTREAGGLLIYISLFEHRVAVLADAAVMAALGQPFLDRLRDTAIARLKERQRLATLVDTVKLASDELAAALPARGDDVDELLNTLVLLHPRP